MSKQPSGKQASKAVVSNVAQLNLADLQRFHADSRANRIAALNVGECESIAKRLLFDSSNRDFVDSQMEIIKGTINKNAQQAAQRTGNSYTVETGKFFTKSGDIVITAVVTRTT